MQTSINKIDTGYGDLWVDDGIIFEEYHKGLQLNGEDAKKEIEYYKNISNGKRMPALIDITPLKSVSKDARDLFASKDTAEAFSAAVLIVNSPIAKVIGNFFIKMNKPVYPVKLMNDKKKAIDWLMKMK